MQEPEDNEFIRAGRVYIAPSDYHLLIDDACFSLSTGAPVSYSRPSIDVLFETAADWYKEKVIGVILTGANKDGANGLSRIKKQGGLTIVQEPETAQKRTMPEAAIAATQIDRILPLQEIAPFLGTTCLKRRKSDAT